MNNNDFYKCWYLPSNGIIAMDVVLRDLKSLTFMYNIKVKMMTKLYQQIYLYLYVNRRRIALAMLTSLLRDGQALLPSINALTQQTGLHHHHRRCARTAATVTCRQRNGCTAVALP